MNSNELVIKGSNYYAQGNYRRAIECLEPAAEQNHTDAMIILGNFYYYGYGVEQNYDTAKGYYERAMRNNDSNGSLRIGNMYYEMK